MPSQPQRKETEGDRKADYGAVHPAPNVVDAWDEYVLEENYEGFEESLARHQKLVQEGTYEAVRVIDVRISDDAV